MIDDKTGYMDIKGITLRCGTTKPPHDTSAFQHMIRIGAVAETKAYGR